MATWSTIKMQDATSPIMEQLIMFHDHTMMILIMITTTITYVMYNIITNKMINRFLMENQTIELIWTMLPAVMLIFIAMPSLRILYFMDEVMNPTMTIKAIGHQWYWSYEYSDFKSMEFESYMKPWKTESMRLLDVDNRVVIPTNTPIRLIVTATDVIHSWTIPSLGIKADAIPGRLNQLQITSNRSGIMYGQCSEICGANHSFMPIVMESVPMNTFFNWLMTN
uniref:cytochrome c oxidase subunit II n=1 Tax=Taiwanaptera montana TaxID=3135762 RepID=UPI0031F340EB